MDSTSITPKYDWVVFDLVNFCYKTFPREKDAPIQVANKFVYSTAACNAIRAVESIKAKYCHADSKMVFLVDNYLSRADLAAAFSYADRRSLLSEYKRIRKKEDKEFYNTVNLIRYYFLTSPGEYYSARIDSLEADDLVKPFLDNKKGKGSVLLVTSDLDWTRYLADDIHWLPSLKGEPETREDLSAKLGFPITESNVVLYKAIFGDPSDNIKNLIPLNELNLNNFRDFIKDCPYAEYATIECRNSARQARWPDLKKVADQERQLGINIQLVAAIPVSSKIFDENFIKSSESATTYKTLRGVLGLDNSKKGFVFGNLKRPRV